MMKKTTLIILCCTAALISNIASAAQQNFTVTDKHFTNTFRVDPFDPGPEFLTTFDPRSISGFLDYTESNYKLSLKQLRPLRANTFDTSQSNLFDFYTLKMQTAVTTEDETTTFFEENELIFKETSSSSFTRNTGIMYNQNFYAPNGFVSDSGIDLDHGFSGSGAAGSFLVQYAEEVTHSFSGEDTSFLGQWGQWLDNVSIQGAKGLLRKINDSENSTQKQKRRYKIDAIGIGVRASVDFIGTTVETASPGSITYELSNPEDGLLQIPFSFGRNKDDAILDIFINDTKQLTLDGKDYEEDFMSTLALDVNGYDEETIELTFLLNSFGDSAEIFIPDEISLTSAVPEPETYAMFLAGLALLAFAQRRQARQVH